MKKELTSALNILVIDKNMYLFPELFFCDIFIPLHAPIDIKVDNKLVATNYIFPNSSL